MEKYILYGAGKWGRKAFEEYGENRVDFFIDRNKAGTIYCGKKVLSYDEYLHGGYKEKVIICVAAYTEIVKMFLKDGVKDFSLYPVLYLDPNAPMSKKIAHRKWIDELVALVDQEGKEVLEIGSRVVTGARYRECFKKANYTGFDFYEGPNVDVVGDAHQLCSYFGNKKFDLIFSSAVFEHFAMPWLVADEIIRSLNVGGYVFIETHYSYCSHERPWHFFQYSEQALKVLFSKARGIECVEAGVCNPLIACFSELASEYLRGQEVPGLYCHSEFLGKKINDVSDLSWENNLNYEDLGLYPTSTGNGMQT